MRWLNLQAAKRDLRGEPLTSRLLLPYLVALSVMEAIVIYSSVFTPERTHPSVGLYLREVASLLLTAIGVYYVYRRNGGAVGHRLLERFLVLGWVASLHLSLLMLVVMLTLGALWQAFSLPDLPDSAIELAFALAVPAYYAYLGHHVGTLAREGTAA